jgi:hypothetical protein
VLCWIVSSGAFFLKTGKKLGFFLVEAFFCFRQHMADEYMQKAIGFVQEAIKADNEDKLEEAFGKYMQ